MNPDLNQLDLVVRDMEATIAFYRALGVEIPEEAIWRTPTGAHHVDLKMPSGLSLHFDSPALASWLTGHSSARSTTSVNGPGQKVSASLTASALNWPSRMAPSASGTCTIRGLKEGRPFAS